MGDSASSPVFAPACEGKSRQFASNLGAKYVWKTTTANNMRGQQRASWATFAEYLECLVALDEDELLRKLGVVRSCSTSDASSLDHY